MAELELVRIDARLVHGQIAAKWSQTGKVNRIIILSDETAADEFMVDLFKAAAPKGTKVSVYSVEKGVSNWKEKKFGEGNAIILFKDIASAKRAYDTGFEFSKLCLGQVPGADNRRVAYATVSLSDEELETLKDLSDKGVDVYFQPLPENRRAAFMGVYHKMMK